MTVLFSFCVPNCFATVEYVLPTATGPDPSAVTWRPCSPHSPCFVMSLT